MDWLVDLHSIWRWIVLLTAVVAIVMAALAAFGVRPWDNLAGRSSFFYTIALDVQVLVGAIVWIINQAWTREAFSVFVHPILMLAAVAVAHVGRSRTERATGDSARGRAALIFFAVSLVIILVAIPIASWPL